MSSDLALTISFMWNLKNQTELQKVYKIPFNGLILISLQAEMEVSIL